MFDKKTKKKIKDLVHVVNSNFLYKEIQENYKEFIDIGKFLFFPGM